MDWFTIAAIFAAPIVIGALLGFWPTQRKRRRRALNRLTERELNKPEAAS